MVSFYGKGFYVSSENQRSTYAGLIVLFTFSCRISKDNPLNYNCASKKCTTFLPSAFFKNKTNTKNTYNMHFDLFVRITSSRVKSVNVIYFVLFFVLWMSFYKKLYLLWQWPSENKHIQKNVGGWNLRFHLWPCSLRNIIFPDHSRIERCSHLIQPGTRI